MNGIAPKTAATAVAGSATIILVWVLHTYAKVDVPPEVASSFTVIIATVASWFAPHATGKTS